MSVIEKAEKAGTISGWLPLQGMREAYGRDHRPSGWRIALVRLTNTLDAYEWAVRPLSGDIRRGVVPVAEDVTAQWVAAEQRARALADDALAAILVEAEEWAAARAAVVADLAKVDDMDPLDRMRLLMLEALRARREKP